MANLGDLLGSFMQNTMSKSGDGRIAHVLQDLQSSLGNLTSSLGSQQGGVLSKVLEMAKTGLGSASQNPAQAAGLGAVLGSVLGGGGKSISGAIKGGALALLAGVAYKALSSAGQGAQGAPAAGGAPQFSGGDVPLGLRVPQGPAEEQAMKNTAELVIKGMINIAKADGQVSADEIQRIVGKLKDAGMEGNAEAWIMAEMRKPLDLDAFVAEIPNQEVAAQVFGETDARRPRQQSHEDDRPRDGQADEEAGSDRSV